MPASERKLHEHKYAPIRLKKQIEYLEKAAAAVPLQAVLPRPTLRLL
jgi:hypothetical protein